MALLIVLVERWHSNHNTFHLPTGEITVTPKDVYRILWIPISGDLVQYDVEEKGGTMALREVFANPKLIGYSVAWQDMDKYAPLPSVVAGLIGDFLYPDTRSHGFSVGWGRILQKMVWYRTRYAWGVCVLAHLYHELHQVVYDEAVSLAVGGTLLQIWA